MTAAEFNLEGITYQVSEPEPAFDWEDVVRLRHEAFTAALPDRSPEEVAYLSQKDNSLEYFGGCLDPQFAVRTGRIGRNQDFANLTVARAFDGNELVGFGYAADNVSGRFAAERWAKMQSLAKRYAWIREVVVHPDLQTHGIGTALGMVMLDHFDERQPVSAYTWEENRVGRKFVRSLGMTETRDKEDGVIKTPVRPFGPGAKEASQIRWTSTVAGVRDYVTAQPESKQAMDEVRWNTRRLKPL